MDNSNQTTNLNEQNNKESNELKNQNLNEEQNKKKSYDEISESTVNIELNDAVNNANNDNDNRDVITESTVNIELNDAVNNANNDNDDRDVITESTVNIPSSDEDNNKDSNEKIQSTTTTAERNPITESTVVISTYQSNDENNENNSFVHLDENKQESNANSIIITNESSSSSSSSESLPSPIDKEFPLSENEEQESDRKQLSNEADDVNLVNSYDIPNFSSTNNNTNNNEIKEEETKKPKRNLEEETYLKILGNDSLMKKITQYGVEDEEPNARPRNGQMVTISYDAYLQESNKLVDHNDNLTFILGDGDVISGLDMVISLMNRNEKCEIIMEGRHAYGDRGREPDIPPNATLIYHVHLKDVKNVTLMNDMNALERLSMAEAKKLRGNYHFNRQDYYLAITSYKKGLRYFDEENLKGDEEQEDLTKYKELSQALLMNLALSNFKMENHREALDSLDQVLDMHNKHIKALYIKGKVLLLMGETQQAINVLNRSLELDPNNVEVKKELAKAQAKHKVQYQNEKNLYKKMMTGVTNEATKVSEKAKLKTNLKSKSDTSYTTYIAAGIGLALVSIGIALFSKYKN